MSEFKSALPDTRALNAARDAGRVDFIETCIAQIEECATQAADCGIREVVIRVDELIGQIALTQHISEEHVTPFWLRLANSAFQQHKHTICDELTTETSRCIIDMELVQGDEDSSLAVYDAEVEVIFYEWWPSDAELAEPDIEDDQGDDHTDPLKHVK